MTSVLLLLSSSGVSSEAMLIVWRYEGVSSVLFDYFACGFSILIFGGKLCCEDVMFRFSVSVSIFDYNST